MNKYARVIYDKFMKMITDQVADGVPVEHQEYMVHPMNTPTMPTIEHRHGKERPQWLDDELDLDGWELLQ